MPTQVKEEVFILDRNVAGINKTNIAVSTGEGLQVIWDYQVPTGMSLIFRHEDHFACYLDATGEVGVASQVDVVISDASRVAVRPILDMIRYAQARGSSTTFLAFSDQEYYNHLDIAPGDVVIAREGERVLVRGNVGATLVETSCYFILTCHRVRHTLFE